VIVLNFELLNHMIVHKASNHSFLVLYFTYVHLVINVNVCRICKIFTATLPKTTSTSPPLLLLLTPSSRHDNYNDIRS